MERQLAQGNAEFFEITDHTTASDWERFIAQLEDILIGWKLNKQTNKDKPYRELPPAAISRGIWHEKYDTIKFGNVTFDFRYQYLGDVDQEQSSGTNINCPKDDPKVNEEFISDSPEYHDAENEKSSSSDEDKDTDDDDSDLMRSNENVKCCIPIEEDKEHGEYELPEKIPECLRDLITTNNDFASKAHCLVRWYNLRKFIILTPKGDTIISEDRVKLVLSSASIALSNIDCHVPIFLKIRNPRNNFYQGISEHYNIRGLYEMVFFKKCIKKYSYMSDLISLFREKTGCNLNDPITATIRLNYCLDFFELFVEPTEEFNGNEHNQDDQDELIKMTMNLKTKKSPPRQQDMRTNASFQQVIEVLEDCLPHPYKILKFLHIAALWPPVSDKVITDSQVHSDLDPAEAPIWTIRVLTSDNCIMKIVHETQAFYRLLCAAIDYAYDKLDADVVFSEFDNRDSLKKRCLKLSYELSTQPEVILSDKPSDSLRKLIALLFYRAAEICAAESEAINQIANHLKKKPSLTEIYRNFSRNNRPSVKEFIIRTQISRPFNSISTPALPQRMFCTVCDEEFRLCGAFTELSN